MFDACDDGVVKRSTAATRLAGIADDLDRSKLWHGSSVVAGYVFGGMLEGAGDVERIQTALVVDEPVEDVPWMSHPVHLEALASLLRFDKLPMLWRWRPSGWPVWNHEIIRAVSFWSTTSGRDQAVIDALASGHLDLAQFVELMDSEELVAQLRIERDVRPTSARGRGGWLSRA